MMFARYPIIVFIFTIVMADISFGQSVSQCENQIEDLRKVLISVNNKISIMPPMAQIYLSLLDIYDSAKIEQGRKNYAECIRLTNVALKNAAAYR